MPLKSFARVMSLQVMFLGVATAPGQSPATTHSTAHSTTPSLNATRIPHSKPAPGIVQEMTPEQLGNFDFDEDKGGIIPLDVNALDGTVIRLRGYMIPMDSAEKMEQFALVSDLFAHPQSAPLVQQLAVVKMPEGRKTDYIPDAIVVEGKLHVRVQKDDGNIISVFDMDATSIRSATPGTLPPPASQP